MRKMRKMDYNKVFSSGRRYLNLFAILLLYFISTAQDKQYDLNQNRFIFCDSSEYINLSFIYRYKSDSIRIKIGNDKKTINILEKNAGNFSIKPKDYFSSLDNYLNILVFINEKYYLIKISKNKY